MNAAFDNLQNLTRRHFLKQAGNFSLGAIALGALAAQSKAARAIPG